MTLFAQLFSFLSSCVPLYYLPEFDPEFAQNLVDELFRIVSKNQGKIYPE